MAWICEEHGDIIFPSVCPGCLQEEVDKLEKIIDSLPKCCRLNDTKDGLVQDVPAVPGMWLYVLYEDCILGHQVSGVFAYKVTLCKPSESSFDGVKLSLCYDTHEAAEFVLNQVNQEKTGGR